MKYLVSVARICVLLLVFGVALSPQVAYAGSGTDCTQFQSSGSGPGGTCSFTQQQTAFDGATKNLINILTGAPAKAISIIAIVVAGVALVFGEDLGAFAKRLLMVVIAVAMIVGAGSIVSTVFGATF
jgi:type IV secretory pathway VirB2 component (pilin)